MSTIDGTSTRRRRDAAAGAFEWSSDNLARHPGLGRYREAGTFRHSKFVTHFTHRYPRWRACCCSKELQFHMQRQNLGGHVSKYLIA
jgi:hypothetical protein